MKSCARIHNPGVALDRFPAAVLFTKGAASVHVEVVERGAGFHLAVRGPGLAVAEYEFADADAVIAFTSEEQARLAAEGFQLQAIAERRRR